MQMWGILVVVVMGKRDRCESLLGLLLPHHNLSTLPSHHSSIKTLNPDLDLSSNCGSKIKSMLQVTLMRTVISQVVVQLL
jgi:hypothetical protein